MLDSNVLMAALQRRRTTAIFVAVSAMLVITVGSCAYVVISASNVRRTSANLIDNLTRNNQNRNNWHHLIGEHLAGTPLLRAFNIHINNKSNNINSKNHNNNPNHYLKDTKHDGVPSSVDGHSITESTTQSSVPSSHSSTSSLLLDTIYIDPSSSHLPLVPVESMEYFDRIIADHRVEKSSELNPESNAEIIIDNSNSVSTSSPYTPLSSLEKRIGRKSRVSFDDDDDDDDGYYQEHDWLR